MRFRTGLIQLQKQLGHEHTRYLLMCRVSIPNLFFILYFPAGARRGSIRTPFLYLRNTKKLLRKGRINRLVKLTLYFKINHVKRNRGMTERRSRHDSLFSRSPQWPELTRAPCRLPTAAQRWVVVPSSVYPPCSAGCVRELEQMPFAAIWGRFVFSLHNSGRTRGIRSSVSSDLAAYKVISNPNVCIL